MQRAASGCGVLARLSGHASGAMPSPGDPEGHPTCFIHGCRWHGDSTPMREEPTPPVLVLATMGHPHPKPLSPVIPHQGPSWGSATRCWVTNDPTSQQLCTVLHGFCGSGTWEQLSWLVLAPGSSGAAVEVCRGRLSTPVSGCRVCSHRSRGPEGLPSSSGLWDPHSALVFLLPPQRRLEARAQRREGSVSASPHVASSVWN